MIDGKPAERCVAKLLPSEIKEYIWLYGYYKKGHPIFSCGITQYPTKLLEIFDILESAEIEMAQKKYKV